MKNIFVILTLTLVTLFSKAQSNFRLGVNYNFGASTYYGNKMSTMEMNGSEMPVYSLKLSTGMGAKIQYSIKEKWLINLNGSYQQRGAMFDKGMYSYNPRYKFNYLDLVLGASYQTKEVIRKSRLCFSIAGTYNLLLNSARVNNYESYNLMNDSKMNDFGAFASVGLNIPRVEKDVIQLSLFANTGFKNVFGGVLLDNGMVGKNLLFGLQIGYLFGFDKKTKKE
ncbi:MAG: hypothetical protein HY062_06025 [Bacteroidetes bacterium]|nr:hypothetical protein [Bacteroidota bacterium]